MTALPVHPFPARMAPEFALEHLPRRLDGGLTVLDPMMGSGTIPVMAALQGYKAIGFDVDPLAVIIARTTGRPLNAVALQVCADVVTERARASADRPYRHRDAETQEFIDRWFDTRAQSRLGALAEAICTAPVEFRDVLWCAFSRLIITKNAGASRARDVSHSRPHVVRETASFDPIERFPVSVKAIRQRHRHLSPWRPPGDRLRLGRGDARNLQLADASVDVVLTSPPYLQAIDYLRGHRMSLVWMDHSVGELRKLRGESIGSERSIPLERFHADVIACTTSSELPTRGQRIVGRYIDDMVSVMKEIRRVLKPSGYTTLVIADATVSGVAVSISGIVKCIAEISSMHLIDDTQRTIPTAKRYLPPPKDGGLNSLDKRMKVEHCLTLGPV